MPPKKNTQDTPPENCAEYTVTDPDMSSLAHGNNVYPVVDGKIQLPKGETWYYDLVGGLLKE